MAITKKTFNQIIKQNSFSGADAGKILIMDYVSLMTKGKRLLTDNEFSQMLNCMSRSPKQVEIYNSYRDFKQILTQFYGFYQTAYCQYEMGRNKILLNLYSVAQKRNDFDTYLKQPLLLTEKEYNKLQADAIKDFENKNIPIWAVFMFYTLSLVRDYSNKKTIPDNIKKLIESYKGKSVNVDYEVDQNENKDFETVEKEENEFLINEFCKEYKIEKSEESIRDFILNSPLMYPYTCLTAKDAFQLDTKDIFSLMELYEGERERQAKYNGEKYKSVFIRLCEKDETHTITETKDKLDYLIELSEWLLDFYTSYSKIPLDDVTKNIWNGLTEFSELLEAVKVILSSKIKKLGSYKSIGYTEPDTIKEKELLKAGLDTLSESDVIRDYFLSITNEQENNIEYIRYNKVLQGGISVYKVGAVHKYLSGLDKEKELLLKYADLGYFTGDLDSENIKDQTKELIENSLCMHLGCIDIFEVYSEIFKVDVTPLSQKWDIDNDIAAYNWLLYHNYNSLLGTEKAIEANRQALKDIFKPLDKRLYRRSPEEKEKIKNELFDIPLKETLRNKYFRIFLEGANVHYDE